MDGRMKKRSGGISNAQELVELAPRPNLAVAQSSAHDHVAAALIEFMRPLRNGAAREPKSAGKLGAIAKQIDRVLLSQRGHAEPI